MAFRVAALKAFRLSTPLQAVPPLAQAAVLLVARTLLVSFRLPCPSVVAIVSATGASRSRAYELAAALTALLPTLIQPRGRPSAQATASAPGDDDAVLTREVLRYVMRHPGCIDRGRERQRYSDGFRCFVLELREGYAEMAIENFALAIEVPLGTVKDWLRAPSLSAGDVPDPPEEAADEATDPTGLHVQTVLDAWRRWEGSLVDFCQHVRHDLRVPFGIHLVRRILNVHAQRTTARRPGRSPDELALRGAFRTFFAGAQWVGDGMQVPVIINGQRFVFNLELDVDAHTAALVGASVRDEEDSAAVVNAFADGRDTTGAPPLALLLDNRPSNHTPQVDAALGDTLRIRATLGRPQNKAHVEGAFGLFSQILPLLALDTHHDPRHIARTLLSLIVQVWARTTNHRPRHARQGNSRVELYAQSPTREQIDEARQALRQTLERQQQARRTLEARRRPDILALLDDAFAELELLDPERHVRLAIAGYPRDPIVNGIAIFRAKRSSHTLPDGVDARYLLGIVKNITAKTEGEYLAEELFDQRTQMRDRILAPLSAERDALLAKGDLSTTIATCVDHALAIPTSLERRFWLDALTAAIAAQPEPARRDLFLNAARRIEATFSLTPDERHDAVRYVADRLIPLR